jgi:hypothetical protein
VHEHSLAVAAQHITNRGVMAMKAMLLHLERAYKEVLLRHLVSVKHRHHLHDK